MGVTEAAGRIDGRTPLAHDLAMKQLLVRGGLIIGLAIAGVFMGCGQKSSPPEPGTVLRVLCGSSMSTPIQELARDFGSKREVGIEFDLGGSETLLPKILTGVRADVFVCHDPFEEKLKEAGRWKETVVVGYLEPVLAVRPGNPKAIRSLADLAKPELKIGIGDPRYSTCGELFVAALREHGLYDSVMKNVTLQGRTHAEIATGLILGPLDAVVVWNFVVPLYPGKLEVVPTGIEYPATRVTVIGLTNSPSPGLRDAFLEWCRQPMAQETFGRYGYTRETKTTGAPPPGT